MNKNKTYAFNISPLGEELNEFDGIKFVDKVKLLGIWFGRSGAARELKENWEGKINQLERTLAMWSRHRLTMFGKVLVIKVFGLSLFIYVMKSIGLPLTILQRINKMFFSFIWKRNFKEGRTFERIKRKVLCTEVEEGGLNMIDIHAMQECFMIKWCLKMIVDQNEKWTALPKKYLESVGEVNAFLCDTSKEDFKGLNTISSDFWKEALFSWIKHRGAVIFLGVEKARLSDLPIFNNKKLTYQGKCLHLEKVIRRGIFLVRDITYEDGTFISLTDFLYKIGYYPRVALDHFTIINTLKNNLDQQNGGASDWQEKAKAAKAMKNQQIRRMINDKDQNEEIPCGRRFWKRKLDCDVSDLYVESIKSTLEVKLKELLFKIYHNIYPTNVILQKIGIKNTNKCDFCQEVDFIDHSLVNCIQLRQYWVLVLDYIQNETNISVPNTTTNKLFGLKNTIVTKKVTKARKRLILCF